VKSKGSFQRFTDNVDLFYHWSTSAGRVEVHDLCKRAFVGDFSFQTQSPWLKCMEYSPTGRDASQLLGGIVKTTHLQGRSTC
jgi:hypothetical protein